MFESITRIQDVFETWRQLGSKRLANGTELIGHDSEGDFEGWLHAIFPRLAPGQIDAIEAALDKPLPTDLRRFYSACGGMILFGGVFRIYGMPQPRGLLQETGVVVDDIITLNHQLDGLDWQPAGAIAIATSEWDGSIFLAGVGGTDAEIVRVDRATGKEVGRADSIWSLVADKLYRLDEMFVR